MSWLKAIPCCTALSANSDPSVGIKMLLYISLSPSVETGKKQDAALSSGSSRFQCVELGQVAARLPRTAMRWPPRHPKD
jgi:hypothetical protein